MYFFFVLNYEAGHKLQVKNYGAKEFPVTLPKKGVKTTSFFVYFCFGLNSEVGQKLSILIELWAK